MRTHIHAYDLTPETDEHGSDGLLGIFALSCHVSFSAFQFVNDGLNQSVHLLHHVVDLHDMRDKHQHLPFQVNSHRDGRKVDANT